MYLIVALIVTQTIIKTVVCLTQIPEDPRSLYAILPPSLGICVAHTCIVPALGTYSHITVTKQEGKRQQQKDSSRCMATIFLQGNLSLKP